MGFSMIGKQTSLLRLAAMSACGAAVLGVGGAAQAATPTYYNNQAAFVAELGVSVTDDYSNPAYVFSQNNAVMSAVIGETDYESTGHINANLVYNAPADPRYCAGCNGSFRLSFLTTSVGTPQGVGGVGVFIEAHDMGTPYFAFVTFADGTTDNIALPAIGTFWGVTAPERIESIHFGLTGGATTQNGSFAIDDLVAGELAECTADLECDDLDPCTDDFCAMNECQFAVNTAPCDDLDACTEIDTCNAGACAGSAVDCNDDNVCTTDSCDTTLGCANDVVAGCCEDDGGCAIGEVCDLVGNVCVPEPAGSSSDGAGSSDGDSSSDDGVVGSSGNADGDTGGVDTTGAGDSATGGLDDSGGNSGPVTGTVTAGGTAGDAGGSSGNPVDTEGLPGDEIPFTERPGCGCTSDPRPPAAWLWIVALGLLGSRRRRA